MVTVPWSIGRDLVERTRGSGDPPARRSLYACGFLIIGYWLAGFVLPAIGSAWWLGGAPVLLIVALLARGLACRVALGLAVLLLGAGWYAARINERPRDSPAWMVEEESDGADPVLATVRGVVVDVPREMDRARGLLGRFSRDEPAIGFTLALSGVEDTQGRVTPAAGELRVSVEGTKRSVPELLRQGVTLRISGRIRPVRAPSNPGEPDWPALAAQEGRIGTFAVPNPSLLEARNADGWAESVRSKWHGVLGAMHTRCLAAIEAPGAALQPGKETQRARALLGALLLGERDAALEDVNTAFARLGILHLVAISGFNLMIMAAFASMFLRLFGDRHWLEPVVVGLLVIGYMLVLPAQAPILRAGVLVIALLVTEASGRRYDRATVLGWIACIMLIVRPMDAWSLGFQLSFGIVAALLLMGTTVHHRIWGVPLRGLTPEHVAHGRRAWAGWWWRWVPWVCKKMVSGVKHQVSAGVLAWAISIPIIACHTGQIGVLTPLMTLIVLPLTVVVLWAGYAVLLVVVLIPSAAGIAAGLLEWPARFLVGVVMWLDQIPGASLQLPTVSVAWTIAGVAGAAYLLMRGARKDVWSWGIAVGLAAWFGAEMYLRTRLPPSVEVRIDSLAVGDGSCYLIRRGDQAALWDCGSLSTGVGERLIPQAMRALGVRSVPTVVVTHAHIDHFAGLPDVVEQLHVERVYVPAQLERYATSNPGTASAELLAELGKRAVRVLTLGQGESVELAGITASVLWPPREREFRDTNDSSIVAMLPVRVGGGAERRVLLTGDAAREALANLLPSGADSPAGRLRADVLELPHHGAYIEPAVELLRVVDPSVVMQSTGPRRAADRRWDALMVGRAWYATPRRGASWVEIGSDGTITSGSYK